MPEAYQQKEIDRLSQTTKELEIAVALASSKAGINEKILQQVSTKLDLISSKIHSLEDNIVTKNNLEVAVNTTLNKHAAKVFWAILTVAVGSVLTWIGSILK